MQNNMCGFVEISYSAWEKVAALGDYGDGRSDGVDGKFGILGRHGPRKEGLRNSEK